MTTFTAIFAGAGGKAGVFRLTQQFLKAYDTLFEALSQVATIKEGGTSGKADLAMSQWMEPARAIGVVAMYKAALKPELLTTIRQALGRLNERFGVVFSSFPTQLCLAAEGDVLVSDDASESDLAALGLGR